MSRFIFFFALALVITSGLSVSAADVPTGSADGSMPTDAGMQSTPAEVKPEPQAESVPAAELATSSAGGPSAPRPTSSSSAKPTPTAVPSNSVTEPVQEAEIATTESSIVPEEPVSPWVWLLGLLGLAGGGIYGAYSLMKASQTKRPQSANACDAIQDSYNQKQYELSRAESEVSFYEEALRVLEEKAQEKAEAEKNKVVKKVEGVAKDTLLGKKGESDARTVFDTTEKAIDTYEDIQKKIKKTKEVLEMLRGKRDGLNAEAKALNASYVACVANLPDAAKALATGGIQLAVPGVRPVRAIIFDWAGVMATEAYWIWVRKNVPDPSPLISIDQKVDSGEMSHEAFMLLLARVSGKTQAEVWAGVKAEMILNQDLIALIRELKKKYKIGLLSNFTAPWLRDVLDEHKLWDLYDEHIISSEHKLVKPDAKIYKKMLTMLDVAPAEAVFADDRQVNIDAAKKVGMRGFVFTSTEQFMKDLQSVGVSMKPKEGEVSKKQ